MVVAAEVDEVVVPGSEGYFGVLPGHAPLLATLGIGELTYRIGREKDHVLYITVDRYDIKQHRELYASTQAAVDAMKAGQPLPDGTVLTLVQYKAQLDAAGMPVKDAKGRFTKGDFVAYTVMEKKAGY